MRLWKTADESWKLYYFEGRNTGIAARSEEEARAKKKRGGEALVKVRTPSEAEKRQMDKGLWVRTRADGKSPGKSELGKGQGYGPPRKSAGDAPLTAMLEKNSAAFLGRGLGLIGRAAPRLHRAARYAAKVPQGERYFSSPGTGFRRVFKTLLSPHLGRANVAKWGVNAYLAGTVAHGAGRGAVEAGKQVVDTLPPGPIQDALAYDLNVTPRLSALKEIGGMTSFARDQPVPPQLRRTFRSRLREGAFSGTVNALRETGKYHPSEWTGKRWAEIPKTVFSPAHKMVAGASGSLLNRFRTKPHDTRAEE
jgi:hypothetical protein